MSSRDDNNVLDDINVSSIKTAISFFVTMKEVILAIYLARLYSEVIYTQLKKRRVKSINHRRYEPMMP